MRCVRCRNVWFAANTRAISAIAQAHRSDLVTSKSPAAPPAPPAEWVTEGSASLDPFMQPTPQADPHDRTEAQPAAPDQHAPPAESAPNSPVEAAAPSPEPFLIDDAPPLAPAAPDEIVPPTVPEDIETVAARRERRSKRRRRGWPLTLWPTAILALMFVLAALASWRARVVALAPQTASLYAAIGLPVNLRGLEFDDVTTTSETDEGVQVLVVEGTIASTAARRVVVPRLRFAVRDAGGHEIYTWTALPTKNVLAPGEQLAFRSRLASPPAEGRNVSVRFFNRRDRIAGLQ